MTIQQLIPTTGWYAESTDGEFYPVAAWALVQYVEPDEQKMHGLIWHSGQKKWIIAENHPKFVNFKQISQQRSSAQRIGKEKLMALLKEMSVENLDIKGLINAARAAKLVDLYTEGVISGDIDPTTPL